MNNCLDSATLHRGLPFLKLHKMSPAHSRLRFNASSTPTTPETLTHWMATYAEDVEHLR